jgi:predicted outer membrane repeat protein
MEGAIWVERSSPVITHCSFCDNIAYGGGAFYFYDSPAIVIDDCFFLRNLAVYGGAIASEISSPTITNCVFSNNETDYWNGGAICIGGGSGMTAGGGSPVTPRGAPPVTTNSTLVTVTNTIFSENIAAEGGGGISCWQGSLEVANCTFYGNSTPWFAGGALDCAGSSHTITNCTFYGDYNIPVLCSRPIRLENTIIAVSGSGQAVYCYYGGSATLVCCNLYGNAGGDWVGCIADQYGIDGNFSACPSFCNADMADFRLCDQSPCLPGNHPDGYECGLIGAWEQGCACGPSRTEETSWSFIKWKYR